MYKSLVFATFLLKQIYCRKNFLYAQFGIVVRPQFHSVNAYMKIWTNETSNILMWHTAHRMWYWVYIADTWSNIIRLIDDKNIYLLVYHLHTMLTCYGTYIEDRPLPQYQVVIYIWPLHLTLTTETSSAETFAWKINKIYFIKFLFLVSYAC